MSKFLDLVQIYDNKGTKSILLINHFFLLLQVRESFVMTDGAIHYDADCRAKHASQESTQRIVTLDRVSRSSEHDTEWEPNATERSSSV